MAPARLSVVEPLLWIAAAIGLALLPLVLSIFQVVQITVFLIFCLLAVSLDLSWGLAGLLSFGQAAFFGIGGRRRRHGRHDRYIAFYGRLSDVFAVMTLTVTLILPGEGYRRS
jgi:ABC-type branched-subunit amino acid transport system permease subunit